MMSDVVRRRPPSLALRLTLSISIAVTLVFWALGWVIQHAMEQHFTEQDVEELEVVAHSVEQVLVNMAAVAPAQDIPLRLAGAVNGHHGMYYLVADATGPRPVCHTRPRYGCPGPNAVGHDRRGC